MAQFYQIVGQGHSLTIEDIQRFCPNICLDGIIVNQEDQQYTQQQVVVQQTEQPNDIIVSEGVQQQLVVGGDGLQYQQQYIIRHEPPPPPPRPDFQQPQQQQNHQQQALHRHQVYYTSDLPVDAQVVLQQQIIDASLMQQSSPQRPQHLVSPAHVLSQPTVIHPAQPPPPQPPPPQQPQHIAAPPPPPQQQPQQLPRMQLQHLQQQHQQHLHIQQLQQQQQQQQQQLQQQQQQLQQQQQQMQQQQQQLQHQLQQQHQQHIQSQQIQQPQQIQHQQVVMHSYINQQSATSTRQAPPRLLNQALSTPSGVTLVRPAVRASKPRRPTMRIPMVNSPMQVQQTRLHTPQHQQVGVSAAGGARAAGAATAALAAGVARARTPRPGSPRVLNLNAPQALHRAPRPHTPLLQMKIGDSEEDRSSPRVLNLHPAQGLHPAARPRTPLHQQQQQQQLPAHQMSPHVLGQQVHQQQGHPQLNQLKLTTQQQHILLNQQHQVQGQTTSRIITPQGTIVTPNMQPQLTQQHMVVQSQGNGPVLQQTNINVIQQRSSPHPQVQLPVKKVVVQPNNANDMDDLEESITAAIVQKAPAENVNTSQQFHTPPPNMRPNHSAHTTQQHHITFTSQHNYQQQVSYDQQHMQQAPPTLTQLLMEPDTAEEDRQLVTLPGGQRITVADYKRMQKSSLAMNSQQQQPRESGRQTLVRSKEQQRPVQRVTPMQAQQQPTQSENNEVTTAGSEPGAEPQSAKMLIFLQNGEQRLITFTLPKESCTLQEVLEQVNVPFTEDTHIQCMQNTSSEIDYFVSVGSTTRIEEMLENHPMLIGDISNRSSPNVLSQPQSSEMSTPEKSMCPDNVSNSPESPEQRSPPPRFVEGMLALCKTCGYTGCDFSRCQRCKRVFTEEPKAVPMPSKKEQKRKEPEKLTSCGEGIKLNLLKTTMKTLNSKTLPQDKKTARVRKPRGKQPDPEPVILTLSSDEEDSNSSMLGNQHEHTSHVKEPTLSEIEGGTPDSGISMDYADDESRDNMAQPTVGISTALNCRTVKIGSYKYTPKEKVFMSSKGIKIIAPSLKNESKEVALLIPTHEIVKILMHSGKGLPVVFLYITKKCGVSIRKELDMTDESGPYYDPTSKVDPFKRITLLPDLITDEAKISMKRLFEKVIDELNGKEANELLVRSCPKESNNVTKMVTRSANSSLGPGAKSANPAEIRQILIYPPGKGGIPINTEDYMCLAQDQFLNDVIIDFYLKHLVHDILTHSQREKTHIFSTFFYKRLTTKPSKVNKSSNPHEWDSSLTPAQKRHARVKTWTKNVNIFDKDFIVVPINENCHWFVAIICYPSLDGCRSMIDNRTVTPQEIKKRERRSSIQIGNTTITPLNKQEQLTLNCDSDNLSERDEAEAEESDLDMQCDSDEEESDKSLPEKKPEPQIVRKNEPIKQPCILIFDSLAGASRSRVVATLRDYLTCEYQTKVMSSRVNALAAGTAYTTRLSVYAVHAFTNNSICKNKIFNKDNIKGSCPKIPQQNNFTDCGLYLLQYVEQFFKDPIHDYSLPIKQLANWFDEIIVTRKREEISKLLKALMNRYNPDSHLTLPDIKFPTLNGKLIETDDQQDEGCEGDKGNSSKKADGKESEVTTLTIVKQMPTGDIFVKRNFSDSSEIIRKTIRLSSDGENRSVMQLKKGDNDSQILIPITRVASELVKDIQNSFIVNKSNKSLGDKKHGLHNQSVSSVNCIRQSISDSESSTFLKTRRIKLDDVMTDTSKKFKRNEC